MRVLDTDHLTILARDDGEAGRRLRARLAQVGGEFCTTIITYEEQCRGWLALIARAQPPDRLIAAYRHLAEHIEDYRSIPILSYDRAADDCFQEIKKTRIRVGSMDLRIAAIALSRGGTLLSRNLRDFGKVPGLMVEDWCG